MRGSGGDRLGRLKRSRDADRRSLPGRQLPLDLGHRAAYGSHDFFVSESNREAVAWLDRWPDWPNAGLAIFGPPGSGKSHLLSVWRARTGAQLMFADRVATAERTESVINGVLHVAFDSADEHIANGTLPERRLLHLYNTVRESGGTILVAARRPPARWDIELPDLRSRLLALPVVEVKPPDDALIAGVLAKLFADRQLAVDRAVIEYIVTRIERSFAAVHALVAAVDAEALSRGRNVTIPLVRQVLGELPAGNNEEG